MFAITLVIMVGLGLAVGPGLSAPNRSIPASDSGNGSAEVTIAEVELRFRDEKLCRQYLTLHAYIKHKFQQITQDLKVTADDAIAGAEMMEQMFVIARIWLQPRRSFADLREMFRITLDCYDNMIDILTRSRPSGARISPVEIMGAVRRHVNQVLDAMESDVKMVVVYNHNKSRCRTHYDSDWTEIIAQGYKDAFVLITFTMLQNLFTELGDKDCDRYLGMLSSMIEPPLESWHSIYAALDDAVAHLKERLDKCDQMPISSHEQRSLSEEAISNAKRRLDEISVYIHGLPKVFELVNDVAQRKFIQPERVLDTYADLWKLRAETDKAPNESNTSHETALQDQLISMTGPTLLRFEPITSLSPWKTCRFESWMPR